LLVIYGLKQIAQDGFGWTSALAILAGLAIGGLFLRRQQVLVDPLVDLRLFRAPGFSGALAINLLSLLCIDGVFLFTAQYLQLVAGLSPWQAGLWTLPWAGGLIVGSMSGPFLVRWIRPSFAIAAGLMVAGIGFGLLTQVHSSTGLLVVALGSLVSSLGLAPAGALATDLIVSAVPPERAGMASGMSETSTELGGALGIAILGSIGVAVYRSQLTLPSLPAHAAAAARDTLGGAIAVAGQLPAGTSDAVRAAARDAFTSGLHVVGLISAAIAVTLAIMALIALRVTGNQVDEEYDVQISAHHLLEEPC
jgi:DHA2 family multidrug resistance protein-like MFS transporter